MNNFIQTNRILARTRNLRAVFATCLTTAVAVCLSGCNSVFYQPDKLTWSLPEQITPSFEEFQLPVPGTNEKLQVWKFHSRVPRKGTVVHFHGNAQNMSAHVWFVAWLIDAGFDVVTFDYRGYGNSDGIATRENTIADGQAVLKWLATQAQSTPLFVVGQSLGGAVAFTSLATSEPEVPVRGLIIESSFTSYRGLARKKLGSFFLTWPLQWPLSFLVTDEFSPKEHKLKNPLPIFFIHGTGDWVVPYREGVKFAELAAKQQNSVSLYSVVGRGHTSCFARLENTPCKSAMLQFMNGLIPSAQQQDPQLPAERKK
ncbi:alpha/beta fold hydrolase [bacterium]|nr:alpha/beta fold hydrolase [bacterium]